MVKKKPYRFLFELPHTSTKFRPYTNTRTANLGRKSWAERFENADNKNL
jgi:hypothetical protein